MKRYLEQLKNININTAALSDYHNRQRLLLIVLICLGVFMAFYWTNGFLADSRRSTAATITTVKERISKVQTLVDRIEDKSTNAKTLDTGLLSYSQGLSSSAKVGSKLMSIKLVSSANRQEQVTFRTENLVINDLNNILQDIEQYDNVWIRALSITRRFDNPKRIDASWDIVRGAE
ncbi:MAG: hypothetical protein LBV09_00365 [Deferribacteraceae bacterium]|jgi:hypothetical protein|nr:hypothetical protein [Deferribacteraceae bacterium]